MTNNPYGHSTTAQIIEAEERAAEARRAVAAEVVHTGNRPHPTPDYDLIAKAKKYGKAKGYAGAKGGWIYDSTGRRICHGWNVFSHKFRTRIELWSLGQREPKTVEGTSK